MKLCPVTNNIIEFYSDSVDEKIDFFNTLSDAGSTIEFLDALERTKGHLNEIGKDKSHGINGFYVTARDELDVIKTVDDIDTNEIVTVVLYNNKRFYVTVNHNRSLKKIERVDRDGNIKVLEVGRTISNYLLRRSLIKVLESPRGVNLENWVHYINDGVMTLPFKNATMDIVGKVMSKFRSERSHAPIIRFVVGDRPRLFANYNDKVLLNGQRDVIGSVKVKVKLNDFETVQSISSSLSEGMDINELIDFESFIPSMVSDIKQRSIMLFGHEPDLSITLVEDDGSTDAVAPITID